MNEFKFNLNVGDLVCFLGTGETIKVEKVQDPEFLQALLKTGSIKQYKLGELFSAFGINGLLEIDLSKKTIGLLLGQFSIILDNGDEVIFASVLFGKDVCLVRESELQLVTNK